VSRLSVLPVTGREDSDHARHGVQHAGFRLE
jgi:hypothetical protein